MPQSTKKTFEISIGTGGLHPEVFHAKVGQPVRWVNDTTSDQEVKFTPTDPAHPGSVAPPDSGAVEPGNSFDYTFSVPGDYHYRVGAKTGRVVVSV